MPFSYVRLQEHLAPSTLQQTAPGSVSYVEDDDFLTMVSASRRRHRVGHVLWTCSSEIGNTSTSGCEAADFAGFPAGNIALVQRGTCSFADKAGNGRPPARRALIIFNQGNTPDPSRTEPFGGTLGDVTGGIPVVGISYP